MIPIIVLSVRLLLAEPGDIQEYKVSGLNTNSGIVQSFVTTDKRFYAMPRGKCYQIRVLDKHRITYGSKC